MSARIPNGTKMIVQITTQPVDMGAFGLARIGGGDFRLVRVEQRGVLNWLLLRKIAQSAICLF
jgi:hypothetical protein